MTTTRPTFHSRDVWHDTPGAFKAGVIVGVAAWFVAVVSTSSTNVNGDLVSCSYLDLAKVAAAVLLTVLAGAGLLATRRSRRPLPAGLALLITGVLVVDAVLLALKGLDIFPSVCASLGA